MNHRNWIIVVILAILAAVPAQAAPPNAEAMDRLSNAADRSIFVPEPFSTSPPERLRTAIESRLAANGGPVRLNMVVILAEFYDQRADTVNFPPSHYDSLLFSRGVYPTGSMADYFYENSNGRLILGGAIRGWYMMPEAYQTYVSLQAGRGLFPRNSQGLTRDAVAIADSEINYAHFDNDGPDGVSDTFDDDRHVDLLMVIHAGPGGESSGSRYSLQSVGWQVPEPIPVDGVYANEFAIGPEDGALGVYAHETGHIMGLPDLYDATGSSFGLGVWTLMSGGWSLNGARTPAHLDAWCKHRLNFVTVVNVPATLDGVIIDPVETGGTVYRLASNGSAGPEYFLVENRERIGFDSFLPGVGLCIYHVNDLLPTNNIPPRYRVGLEQADGLFQLENLYGNPSFGDAGDLYTEDTPSGGFGRFTVPDSRNHAGAETGITVYNIQGPDETHSMRASFRTVIGPSISIASTSVVPVNGDGDEFVEEGETFEVLPTFLVQGGVAHDVVVQAFSSDPLAQVGSAPIPLGDLGAGNHQTVPIPIGVGTGVPRDPYGLPIRLKVSFREEIPVERSFTVAVGHTQGMAEDFENGFHEFTHRALRFGFLDLWRPESEGGNAGPHAWHCGNSVGGFNDDTDAALETPLFIIPPNGVLKFDHLVEIPPDDSGNVVAGAFVEISVGGSNWTQITPTRGYDRRFFHADPELSGRYIFTGDPQGPEPPLWEPLTFDLSGFQGGAVVRFRFFSTAHLFVGKGWWIDNVRVESSTTPVSLVSLSAARATEGVALSWVLSGPEEISGLSVWRATWGGSEFVRLNDRLLPARPTGLFHDLQAVPEERYVYRLEAVRRDGTVAVLGHLEVPEIGTRPDLALNAFPNPARNGATIAFKMTSASPVRLWIFDTQGRVVKDIVNSRLEAGEYRFGWDGEDGRGQRVPAGVYFYRLERDGDVRTRKLVVAR